MPAISLDIAQDIVARNLAISHLFSNGSYFGYFNSRAHVLHASEDKLR